MKNRSFLILALIPCVVFAGDSGDSDDVYKKLEKSTKANVEMQYLETMRQEQALKRKHLLQRNKEKVQDLVNSKRKKLLLGMLKMNPGIQLNTQGVVGRVMIINNYAIPSGSDTPYGVVKTAGVIGYVGDSMVAPNIGSADYKNVSNYVETINSLENSYYNNVPLSLPDNVSSGNLPSLTNVLSAPPPPPSK